MLENFTKKTAVEIFQEQVLEPLGMMNAYFPFLPKIVLTEQLLFG